MCNDADNETDIDYLQSKPVQFSTWVGYFSESVVCCAFTNPNEKRLNKNTTLTIKVRIFFSFLID